MNYWSLFRDSFGKLLIPALWVFGFLTALGGGVNYRLNFSEVRPLAEMPIGLRELLGNVLRSASPEEALIAGLALTLIVMIFGAFGQAALIKLINRSENGERVTIGLGIDDGGRRFLHLMAVRILLAIPLLIIGAAAVGSLWPALSNLFSPTSTNRLFDIGDVGRLMGLTGLALIVGLLTSAIAIGAERAVVLEELPIFQSIALGVKLLLAQLGDYIVIAVLFILVVIAFGLMFGCMLIPVFLASASFGSLRPGIAVFDVTITGPMANWVLIAGLLIGTLVAIFTTSVWTLAYRQWRAAQVVRPAPTA